jgi:hypothetical protein
VCCMSLRVGRERRNLELRSSAAGVPGLKARYRCEASLPLD